MRSAPVLVAVASVLATGIAFAAPSVTITSPTSGAVVGDPVLANGSLSSTYDVASLTVSVGAASASYTTAVPPAWGASLPIPSVPYGASTFTVTVRDVVGGTATASVPVFVDRPPSLTVTSPADDAEATPNVTIAATCSDDAPTGCVSITAKIGTTVIASSTSTISGSYSLAAFQGRTVVLTIAATDTGGRIVSTSRTLAVTGGTPRVFPGLTEIVTVPGQPLDFDGARVLHATPLMTGARIRTLSPASVAPIYSGGSAISAGSLVAGRAALQRADGAWEWNGSALTKFGTKYAAGGTKILFTTPFTSSASAELVIRDPLTSTSIYTESGTSVMDYPVLAAAPNDDFAWSEASGFWHLRYWRAGVRNTVAGTGGLSIFALAIDGTNVSRVLTQSSSNETKLVTPSGTELAAICYATTPGPVCDNALVANGWTAYNLRGSTPSIPQQVWRRTPSGTTEKLSVFSTECVVEALGETGEVIYKNDGRRYLASDGKSIPREVSTLGRPRRVAGAWYVFIDNAVYRFEGSTSGDAGVDGGSPDTSTPDTSVADTSMPDTSVADTSMPDTSVADTSVMDSTSLDSAADSAIATDTAIASDTGIAPLSDEDGGCGVAHHRGGSPWLAALGIALFALRRRRPRASSA